jgi:Small Multidrug Resistance protein.
MKNTQQSGGYLLAAGSIVLVTLAQLLFKYGLSQLPAMGQPLSELVTALLQMADYQPLLLIAIGIAGYGGSLLCWLGALRYLPLHRAYPLLALSYGLVYLGAVLLPWMAEPFSWIRALGVVLIMLGVGLSQSPGKPDNH